jgi:O-succinylbenzoate synthase
VAEVSAVRIWASRYTLQPRASLSAKARGGLREGALIRVETLNSEGFADLHPWTELGDLSLDHQLESLAAVPLQGADAATPLVKRALAIAELDGEARQKRTSCFQGLTLPRNHYLATDLLALDAGRLADIQSDGFRAVKVKIGRDLEAELAQLKRLVLAGPGLSWRFDFNGTLTPARFEDFALALGRESSLARAIEFIEDPVAWAPQVWAELQAKTALPLALDRGGEALLGAHEEQGPRDDSLALAARWLIIKPAVQDPKRMAAIARRFGWRIAVTSYLDHPLGQVAASLEAARFLGGSDRASETSTDHVAHNDGNSATATATATALGTCGLASHFAYEKNEFSEVLEVRESVLLPPPGTGLGFDELLGARDWTRVR